VVNVKFEQFEFKPNQALSTTTDEFSTINGADDLHTYTAKCSCMFESYIKYPDTLKVPMEMIISAAHSSYGVSAKFEKHDVQFKFGSPVPAGYTIFGSCPFTITNDSSNYNEKMIVSQYPASLSEWGKVIPSTNEYISGSTKADINYRHAGSNIGSVLDFCYFTTVYSIQFVTKLNCNIGYSISGGA
jgi:hypothetical protein